MGAERSDKDYCEELQHPEEEVTLDVCQSSRTCPLPKAGAPATGPPATDPSCRLAGQRRHIGYRAPREEVFSFVNTDVVHNLELEKSDYNIAASNADAGHDLWAFCHDKRLRLSFWYNVSKGHSVDSAIFYFHGAGVFYPSRVLGREARDLLKRPN